MPVMVTVLSLPDNTLFMDKNNIKVLFSGAWLLEQVQVTEIKSSRLVDESLEQSAIDSWKSACDEAVQRGSELWDSEVYRLENVSDDEVLSLQLSTIPFSVRLGMNKHTVSIQALGENYAPKGMFTSCLLTTTDDKFVFIEKSNKFYTNKKYAWVGGVLSKTEHQIQDGVELFNTIRSEILEEVGCDHIPDIVLRCGYLTENWNVCLLFSASLAITSAELSSLFEKKSDGEAKNLLIIPKSEIENKLPLFETKDQVKLALLDLV